MLEVVQSCANYATHLLQAIQLELVLHAALGHEVVESLADVGSVRLIMVSDALVSGGQLPHEAQKFIEFDVVSRHQPMLSK